MNKFTKYIYIPAIAGALLLSGPVGTSYAAQSKDQTYEQWLENYGAWDKLESQLKTQNTTQLSPLQRAELYLKGNDPEQAYTLIQQMDVSEDNATESVRLWTGGKALLGMGDPEQAVFWFSKSLTYLPAKDATKKLNSIPELKRIWKGVWRKSFWAYQGNQSLTKEAQQRMLNLTKDQGIAAFGGSFWEEADKAISTAITTEYTGLADLTAPKVPDTNATEADLAVVEGKPSKSDAQNIQPLVTSTDKKYLAASLASISLEQIGKSSEFLKKITSAEVQQFWNEVYAYALTGQVPSTLDAYSEAGLIKPLTFWNTQMLSSVGNKPGAMILGNINAASWVKLRDKILDLPVDEAITAIENELGSLLISPQNVTLLQSLRFALCVANERFETAGQIWDSIDRRTLPTSLQLSGIFLFGGDINTLLPQNPTDATRTYSILTQLASAGGQDLGATTAPFWTKTAKGTPAIKAADKWPLDKVLLLAYMNEEFAQKPSTTMAKRVSLLFPDSEFGAQCMLYLAKVAVDKKEFELATFYMNRLNKDNLTPLAKSRRLEVLAAFYTETGREDKAVATYRELMKSSTTVPAIVRLKYALTLQQRGDLLEAQKQLMELLNYPDLDRATMAEIYFWLGEGEHASGNKSKALDWYLKLAWKYPEQNIWALTAMYRASMIYESQGQYDTAAKLLGTVIKNADRKEQKEAARVRLNAIQKKTGGKLNSSSKSQKLTFPL
ncbi:MAG: tetratricopeptide repeat protein [Desulfovibrio sp.]